MKPFLGLKIQIYFLHKNVSIQKEIFWKSTSIWLYIRHYIIQVNIKIGTTEFFYSNWHNKLTPFSATKFKYLMNKNVVRYVRKTHEKQSEQIKM